MTEIQIEGAAGLFPATLHQCDTPAKWQVVKGREEVESSITRSLVKRRERR